MLARMSVTPSVMTVNRGMGAFVLMLLSPSSEQTQLLSASLRPDKMIGRQFRTALVEAELFAGDLEAAADHPGHRAGPLHPRAPLRVVVATAAHVADQGEDVAITIGIVRHQPFAEKIAHFERQPQQHVARFLDARERSR